MNSLHTVPPRFVPTLTEIVQQGELAEQTLADPPVADHRPLSEPQQVQHSSEPELHPELDSLVRDMVAEQLEVMRPGLRSEIQSLVRQAVAEALADRKSDSELK